MKERGAVTWNTYRTYFKAAGGYCASGLAVSSFALPVLCASFCNWWLSYWIAQGSGSYDYGLVCESDKGNAVSVNDDGDNSGSDDDCFHDTSDVTFAIDDADDVDDAVDVDMIAIMISRTVTVKTVMMMMMMRMRMTTTMMMI